MGRASRWLVVLTATILAGAVAPTGSAMAADPEGTDTADATEAAPIIDRYRAEIPRLMTEQGVPGLSIALVDGDRVLWAEGFGTTARSGGTPVTADTIFSVQSMSKLFTATAVLQAVQDGLLDLDVPITTYLPDFTVHSVFETHPERRITLRMLLSHTAGFTHEAPVGNNFLLDPGTFDAHVRSISDTWLRFPAGTGFAYSNLGIDLAGFILQTVRGEPFATVVQRTLLRPLGMDHSTFDIDAIRVTADRALGTSLPLPRVPDEVPMLAAGGLYSSANDLARFLRFQLGGGAIDGTVLLRPDLVAEMRTVQFPTRGAPIGFGLGQPRTIWRAGRYADLFSHGGGGFGFIADLWWLPQLQLGIAVLTNSADHHLQGSLALGILRDLVDAPGTTFNARLLALPDARDAPDPPEVQLPAGLTAHLASIELPATAEALARRSALVGSYGVETWGVLAAMVPPGRLELEGSSLWLETNETGTPQRLRLYETEPGLFVTSTGEALDARGATPTWRNIALVRLQGGPSMGQAAVLGLGGMLSLGWLLAAGWGLGRRLTRRPRRPLSGTGATAALVTGIGVIASVLAIGCVVLLAAVPWLVDAGFIGWLQLPTLQRLALHLPLATALATLAFAAVALLAWRRGALGRRTTVLALLAILGTGSITALVAAWRLIGWGLG